MSDFIDGFEFDDDAIVDFIIEFIKQNPEKFITPDLKRRQRRREDFSIAEVALALPLALKCMHRGVKILLRLTSSREKSRIDKGVCAGVKINEKSHVHI